MDPVTGGYKCGATEGKIMFGSQEDMSLVSYYRLIESANILHSPFLTHIPFSSSSFAFAFVLSSHSIHSLLTEVPHVISPCRKQRNTVILLVMCSRGNRTFIRIEMLSLY